MGDHQLMQREKMHKVRQNASELLPLMTESLTICRRWRMRKQERVKQFRIRFFRKVRTKLELGCLYEI